MSRKRLISAVSETDELQESIDNLVSLIGDMKSVVEMIASQVGIVLKEARDCTKKNTKQSQNVLDKLKELEDRLMVLKPDATLSKDDQV